MVKLLIVGAVAVVAITVYTLIDCAWLPRQRIRALPRAVWLLLVLILPLIGAALWYVLGRAPASAGTADGRYRGPDDDPDFLGTVHSPRRSRSEKEQDDATLRHLEDLLDSDDDGRKGPGRPER
jgi:hypothetical protein